MNKGVKWRNSDEFSSFKNFGNERGEPRYKEKDRNRDRERERERDRERDRDRERNRDNDRDHDPERHKDKEKNSSSSHRRLVGDRSKHRFSKTTKSSKPLQRVKLRATKTTETRRKEKHKQRHKLVGEKTSRDLRSSIAKKIERIKKRSKYELMNEAFYVANQFLLMNSTMWTTFEDEYYILNNKWFERWKKYVNFDYFMNNNEKFLKLTQVVNGGELSVVPGDETTATATEANHNKIESKSNSLAKPFSGSLGIGGSLSNSSTQSATLKPLSNDQDERLNNLVKEESEKFFINTFLNDNSDDFPGIINNRDLLVDKSLHYVDFNNKYSHLNYNIMDHYQLGVEFFLINKRIWQFLKSIYGGKEIKRYAISISPNNEQILELKLMNIKLCIIKLRGGRLEKHKILFVSRKFTVSYLKNYTVKIFSFLAEAKPKNIRLWSLDPTITFDSFEDNLLASLASNRRKKVYLNFPGVLLDNFEDALLGDIDDLIQNRVIFLENLDSVTANDFMFVENKEYRAFSYNQNQSPSLFKTELDYNKYWQIYNNETKNYFDKVELKNYSEIHKNFIIPESLATLKDLYELSRFFKYKYGIEYTFSKSFNKRKSILREAFDHEVDLIKKNISLVINKSEALLRYRYTYSANEPDKYSNILKRREKEKITKQLLSRKSNENALGNASLTESAHPTATKIQGTQLVKPNNNEIENNNLNLNLSIGQKKITEEASSNVSNGNHDHDLPNNDNKHNNDETNSEAIPDSNIYILENQGLATGSEDIEETCKYCSKPLEEEFQQCEKCIIIKYCNLYCMNKDKRFHSKICNVKKDV